MTEGTSLGGDYMPLRIVRNDIVKMTTDAIVNTAMIMRSLEQDVTEPYTGQQGMMNF